MRSSPLSWRDRFYPKIWLIGGIFILLVSAILWIWLQLAARVTKENSFTDDSDTATPKVVMVDRFPASLGSLIDIVPVLDLSKVADKQESTHSPEFQTAAFIGAHESEWTLQVMNVSQESVVTDFLAKRNDRARFQYFHYRKGEKDESYILTYGAFTTVQTAMGAMQTMDFGLPGSVKAFPERFSTYKPFVSLNDDTGVNDSANIQRQIKLRPVAIPPPSDAIEDKLAQLSAQSVSTAAPAGTSSMPAGVDGFSGQPDAPPSEPAPSQTTGTKASSPAPIQDPFN
ncbi:MAG: hypothetical protein KGO49_06515 [Gammaproteobacteria bacterium]|nr:hypothetical protein [Gammaproteobacteria bacterium]